MFKITIHIEREVTSREIEEFSKFSKLLKKGDKFSLIPLDETEKSPEAPSMPDIIPASPVVVVPPQPPQPRKNRSFGERLDAAFSKAASSLPDRQYELEILRNALAWQYCDRDEWVPFRKNDLCDITDCKDPELAYTLVYYVLKYLGRQPMSNAKEVLLPPSMQVWTMKKETERKAQEERNIQMTGDPNIGVESYERPTTAITPPEILYAKLSQLVWENSSRESMTIRTFMKWAGFPFTKGNAIRLGRVAREFGGLHKVKQTRDGVFFAFPLPRTGSF